MAAADGMKMTQARQFVGQKVAALDVSEPPAKASSEEFSAVDRCCAEDKLSATGSITNQLRPRCQPGVIHSQMRSAWTTF